VLLIHGDIGMQQMAGREVRGRGHHYSRSARERPRRRGRECPVCSCLVPPGPASLDPPVSDPFHVVGESRLAAQPPTRPRPRTTPTRSGKGIAQGNKQALRGKLFCSNVRHRERCHHRLQRYLPRSRRAGPLTVSFGHAAVRGCRSGRCLAAFGSGRIAVSRGRGGGDACPRLFAVCGWSHSGAVRPAR
jgi:hypothetical protein